MIDSHCHLNASYTVDSVSFVIEKFLHAGGRKIIDVTTTLKDFEIACTIAEKYPHIVHTTIGIHPEECTSEQLTSPLDAVKELFSAEELPNNVVGIGETGLDYSYLEDSSDNNEIISTQIALFILHVNEAKKRNLPLVIHARGKNVEDYSLYDKIIELLDELAPTQPTYYHSFAGDNELAQKIVAKGNMIGINGIITYSGAKILADVVKNVPLTNILLETDSPFLIPSNMDRSTLRDKKINEPIAIASIAKRVASLKGCTLEAVLEITSANAMRFFNLT